MTKIYYATTFRKDEINALKAEKVDYILVSFALWQNKPLQLLVDELGYRPKSIILDPGAVTFRNADIDTGICDVFDLYLDEDYEDQAAGNEIFWWAMNNELREGESCPFYDYLSYIIQNQKYIDHVLSFDHMDYSDVSGYMYRLMKVMGYNPIPVFHYQEHQAENYWDDLDHFVKEGNELIALGGILKTSKVTSRVKWAKECIERYPNQKFHLLGCQRKSVLMQLPELSSCDGNAWKITAGFKRNRHPGQSKVQKSIEIIREQKMWGNRIG